MAKRMRDCLERQLACYRQGAEVCETVFETDPLDVEAIAALQVEQECAIETLEREFRALLREWSKELEVDGEERIALRGLARETEAAAGRLMAVNERIAALGEEHKRRLVGEQERLRAGRQLLNRYRAGEAENGGLLDTKT